MGGSLWQMKGFFMKNMQQSSDIENVLKYIIFAFKKQVPNEDIELFKKNIGLLKYEFFDIKALYTFDEESCNDILTKAVIITDNESLDIKNGKLGECAILGVGFDYRGNAPFITESLLSTGEGYLLLVYARKHNLPVVIGETKRLLIREMSMQDLDSLYELYDSLKACPYIEPLYERSEEEEFSRKYIENMYGFYNYGLWLVFLKDTNKLIGRAGIEHREINGELCHEIGYLIDKAYQHNHYALEVCEFIVNYAFDKIEVSSLIACINKNNTPSINLAKRLGFSEYKTIDEDILYRKCSL